MKFEDKDAELFHRIIEKYQTLIHIISYLGPYTQVCIGAFQEIWFSGVPGPSSAHCKGYLNMGNFFLVNNKSPIMIFVFPIQD